jgi:phage shock protein PspC (stress-responsive transcriptional regulator)
MSSELNFGNYAWMGTLAFCGAFMRAARWYDPKTEKFLPWKMLRELPVAFASGAVAIGIGSYFNWDIRIVGGIAGLMGLLGPSVFDAILTFIKVKLGMEK